MQLFFLVLWIVAGLRCSSGGRTQKEILEKLLAAEKYDVNDHPLAGTNRSVKVDVQLYINSFGSLDAAHMEYRIDTFLRQTWNDPRLKFREPGKDHLVVQDPKMRNQIWKPDTFFGNLKDAKFHMVTMPNILFRVHDNGDVLYSMRLSMKLSCYMDFSAFPLDSQNCAAKIASYSRTERAIQYRWDKETPIVIPKNLEIAQFDLLNKQTEQKRYNYSVGIFSGLEVHFTLRRQNGYHMLQTYIPTIIIVCMSWVSFWIDPTHVPGRVTLGVTTLLTLTTLASGIRSQLPPVSYVKAIDIWVGMCMMMGFGGLLEFTLANWLANKKIPPGTTPYKIPQFIMMCSWGNEEEDTDADTVPKPATTYISQARAIDRVCRALFPATFLLFNLGYWPFYLMQQNKPNF